MIKKIPPNLPLKREENRKSPFYKGGLRGISHGYSFIEVLIALFILSIGLLGIAEMEISALKNTQAAYWQSIATIQLANIFERFRANPYARSTECEMWNLENRYLLPNGQGQCSCTASMCTVSLQWRNQQMIIQAAV